jgi:hypothetical protein
MSTVKRITTATVAALSCLFKNTFMVFKCKLGKKSGNRIMV